MVDIKFKEEEPGCLVNIKKIPGLGGNQGKRRQPAHRRAGDDPRYSRRTRSCARNCRCFGKPAHQFASLQVRNTATIGGNICRASPSGETLAPLLVLEAKGKLALSPTARRASRSAHSSRDRAKAARRVKGLLTEIEDPYPPDGSKGVYLKARRARRHGYRHGRRRRPDHAGRRQRIAYKMSASVWAPSRRRRFARRKPKRCCAANRSTRRSLKEAAAMAASRIEPDQRSAQQRGEPPLDRRSTDPPRSANKAWKARHRQGGSIMSRHDQHDHQRQSRSARARKHRRRCWNFSATPWNMKGSETLLQHR